METERYQLGKCSKTVEEIAQKEEVVAILTHILPGISDGNFDTHGIMNNDSGYNRFILENNEPVNRLREISCGRLKSKSLIISWKWHVMEIDLPNWIVA